MHFFGAVIVPSRVTFDEACGIAAKLMDPYFEEYNEEGFWDWYQVGGRWTGVYSEYDPQKDSRNIVTCNICNGTGIRPGGLEEFGQAWFDACKGCNGCSGEGKHLKWATDWAVFEGDLCPVSYALNTRLPHTVVDENGVVGSYWFGEDEEQKRLVREKLEKHVEEWLLVIDYHS